MFTTHEEYETGIVTLKERLKERVRSVFEDICIECQHHVFDVWGHVLDVSKPDFMAFTNGANEEWCDKISSLFETSFDSVLYVVFSKDKDIEMETLELFIDNFFDKCHIFDEILVTIL